MGRTFVHLLTGIPPIDFPTDETTGKINWRNQTVDVDNFLAETTGKINWRNQTVDVDNLLADFIDELMEPLPEKRPENSQVILEKLKTISLLITSAEPK